MIKRLKRWFKNEPNSKLTTLIEHDKDACYAVAKMSASFLCPSQIHRYRLSRNFVTAGKACDACPLEPEYEGHKLNQLIKRLEQINEQTKHAYPQRPEE